MTASPGYGSVIALLGSQLNISGGAISIAGIIGSILVALINNWGQSRREDRARRYASGEASSSGVNLFAVVLLLVSIGGLIYVYKTRKVDTATDDTSVATLVTEPNTSPSSAVPPSAGPVTVPIPVTTSVAEDHLCWASTVQLAARPGDDPNAAMFASQSNALAQALPQLGPLHDSSSSTPVCNSGRFHLFYFGPFDSVDIAAQMCSAIGQVLHDSAAASYSLFVNAQGEIQYPFYFTNYGKKALTPQGNLLLCGP